MQYKHTFKQDKYCRCPSETPDAQIFQEMGKKTLYFLND